MNSIYVTRRGTHAERLQARLDSAAAERARRPASVTQSSDGRRWLALTQAQLRQALGDQRPKTMASVNALAAAWARGRGYDGAVGTTIDDLVRYGWARHSVGQRRPRRGSGFVTVGRFTWRSDF